MYFYIKYTKVIFLIYEYIWEDIAAFISTTQYIELKKKSFIKAASAASVAIKNM